MERIIANEDVVDLGDAAELTRGALPVGLADTDGIQFRLGEGLSEDD